MSKSRGNGVALGATADDTAAIIRTMRTDGERTITFDPVNRPEVASLLSVAAFCRGTTPEQIAHDVGSGGAAGLKTLLTESVNEYLRPIRVRRADLADADDYLMDILRRGNDRATDIAERTLTDVKEIMGMTY